MRNRREKIKKNYKGFIMSEILNYAVYKLDLDEIENSDDWFDANGQLKYKERFLFDALKEAGRIEASWPNGSIHKRAGRYRVLRGRGAKLKLGLFLFLPAGRSRRFCRRGRIRGDRVLMRLSKAKFEKFK